MKSIIKTIKTLELVWPGYSLASSMCRILDCLEEDLVPYWEPYWEGKRDEIGIRFASEEGEIEAVPGCVVTIEDGYAVRMRKNLKNEHTPTTRINEKKRAVAYVYDVRDLKDLRALSEGGHRVEIDEGRILVGEDRVNASGDWVIEDVDTRSIRAVLGSVTLDEIAEEFGGKLA